MGSETAKHPPVRTDADELTDALDAILPQDGGDALQAEDPPPQRYSLEELLSGLPVDPDTEQTDGIAFPAEDAAGNAEPADEVLELTEGMVVPDEPPPHAATDPETQPEAVSEPEQAPASVAAGLPALPADEVSAALAVLLADPPPTDDFAALDALYDCWPRNITLCEAPELLAVARNLTRNFGLPGRLPMAAARAWRMLSPAVFQDEMAEQLVTIGGFIAEWQRSQRTFLILEFGEIELIETLFEALDPGEHADLLVAVMNFKVLSNRRMGLLRRIPTRVRRQIDPLLPDNRDQALVILSHTRTLLRRIADPAGFAPIVEAATKAEEEINKMIKATAAIGAPPPASGGGGALGRIG